MLRKAVDRYCNYLYNLQNAITKSRYNRINLFLTIPCFWVSRFLLTCQEFSPFSQSGEGPGNKCCVRQLIVLAKGMRIGNFNVFFRLYLSLLLKCCLQ